jgi:hypothetical protein
MNPDECSKANGSFVDSDVLMESELDYLNLKETINNFLWERLHSKTTLGEAEKIAVEIYNLVTDNHEKYS